MVSILLLGLTLFLGAVTAAPSTFPDRIVGGTATNTNQYPAIVQLEFHVGNYYWDQSCGANIITSSSVLSAAHCTHSAFDWSYSPQARRIRAGANNRNTGGVVVNVQSVLNHPSFNIWSFDNDICIIKLTNTLSFGNNIQSIAIPPQNFNIPDNSAVIHAGWGHTTNNGVASNVLQHVTIFTINQNVCAQRYGSASITQNMICAGILNVGGKDACQGDSGGPLYYGGVLTGLVSWGGPCADPYYPGVSTRVSSYTNWIVSNA